MKSHIDIQGEGAGKIKPGADNMVLQAMQAVAGKVGKEIPGGELKLINQIPLARGVGSSSAALVSGAYLANQLCGNVLNRHEILNIVTELEGHTDNVAPAIFGGFCFSIVKDNLFLRNSGKSRTLGRRSLLFPILNLEQKMHGVHCRILIPERT